MRQFDALYAEVESDIPEALTYIILGLGTYSSPVNALSKKMHAIHRGMRKTSGLKVGISSACLVELDKYLAVLPGEI